jgi:hypothetical protein
VEEEVAAVEVDEIVHKGPDKKGRVLRVVSHNAFIRFSESLLRVNPKAKVRYEKIT